jgi:hypothetical protein
MIPVEGKAPFGWDVWTHTEVIPKPDPKARILHWHLVIGLKPAGFTLPDSSTEQGSVPEESEITLQLTADQMVHLSVSGTDAYGNPVDITGDAVWQSSDNAIVRVLQNKSANPTECFAIPTGVVGSASVTYTNDTNRDGSGDFIGSIAIDVVAGQMTEIVINADEPVSKAQVPPDATEQPPQPGGGGEHPDNTLPNEIPVTGEPPVVDPRSKS